MADIQFDTPTEAPTASSGAPYTRFLNYKSGKTPEAFALSALPEQVKAGFSYYDKEAKQAVKVENFTACVVAVLSGVTGTVKNGEYYDNYYSNFVFDTRTELIKVRQFGIEKVLFSGLYRDFKDALPQGVGYSQFLIAYIPELKEVVSIELTAGLSAAIQRAIAETTNTAAKKVNLFHLCDISTKFWCFKFGSEFAKRDKEGKDYSGKGEMYFMPKIQVFVVSSEKNPQFVADLDSMAVEVREYVSEGQRIMRNKPEPPAGYDANNAQHSADPFNTADAVPFPERDLTDYETTAKPEDPLPF